MDSLASRPPPNSSPRTDRCGGLAYEPPMSNLILKRIIEKNGDTHARLADAIGVTKKKLRRKLKGKSDFNLTELCTIVERYRLTPVEAWMAFFSPDNKKARR